MGKLGTVPLKSNVSTQNLQKVWAYILDHTASISAFMVKRWVHCREMFYVWLTVLARLKGGSPCAMLTHKRLLTNQIAIHHLVISGGNEC